MDADVISKEGRQFLRLLGLLRSPKIQKAMPLSLVPLDGEGWRGGPNLGRIPADKGNNAQIGTDDLPAGMYLCSSCVIFHLCSSVLDILSYAIKGNICGGILSLAICTTFLLFPLPSQAHIAEEWTTKEGYFCTLYIRQDVDVEMLNRKIDTYRVDFGLSQKPIALSRKPQDELSYKFDVVFLKVQELLDMRPQDVRLNVKIYPSKEDIDKIYVKLFNERGGFIAFYVFNLNTLFACEEKISASVVAHEMAHCILDHHFAVQPPKKIAELLAHYAELHLRD